MKNDARTTLGVCLALTMLLTGCGGGSLPALGSAQRIVAATSRVSTSTSYTCPTAETSSGPLNCTDLPLGDLKTTKSPKAGYIDACQTASGSPVVSSAPWIARTTWNLLEKVVVEGSVAWAGTFASVLSSNGGTRTITSKGVPMSPYTTGTFPIATTDPAYTYDRNPNKVEDKNDSYALPGNPTIATTPSCLPMGTIGLTVTGVAIYNAFDASDYDAVAREEQDSCHGHPDSSDTYHYHGILQACVPDAGSTTANSSLLGYALDGFGIYGPWYSGKILTTADLDECHGVTSQVLWNGKLVNMYHYVSTYQFPYTLGCFRGKPVAGQSPGAHPSPA